MGAPLFGSTLAPRRSIAFRNSAGTWSRVPGKQLFGILGRWRDRHTRPARWSDTLRIRPVRWRKWNRIRIDLARLADPIQIQKFGFFKYKYKYKYFVQHWFKYKYKYKYIDSNTNTNTFHQIYLPKLLWSKIGQFYESQDICSWPVFPYV